MSRPHNLGLLEFINNLENWNNAMEANPASLRYHRIRNPASATFWLTPPVQVETI